MPNPLDVEEESPTAPADTSGGANSNDSTQPTEVDVQKDNKYELLDRLFTFIDTPDELNPVLAGYFSKLL